MLFISHKSLFLSWVFDYVEKRLNKKTTVNIKIYDDTDWTKTITIHTLLAMD